MGEQRDIWVLGGDRRQARLAEQLAEDGCRVRAFALEEAGPIRGVEQCADFSGVGEADCVILPLPAAGEGETLNAPYSSGPHQLAELLDALRPGQVICAGRVEEGLAAMAARRGLTLRDYFAREELAVANAVPAASAVRTRCTGSMERTSVW